MLKRITRLALSCLILIPLAGASAQTEMFSPLSQGTPNFICNIQNVAGDSGSSELVVSIKIPYDELLFLKSRDGFRAKAEITITLNDENNEQTYLESFNINVSADNYDSTSSRTLFHYFSTTIDSKPGDFTFHCQVTDLDSRSSAQLVQKITLQDFAAEGLSISDLTLFDATQLSEEYRDMIREMFADTFDELSNFVVAKFEVYSNSTSEKLIIEYDLVDFRSRPIQSGKVAFPKKGYRTGVFLPFSPSLLSGGIHEVSLKIEDGDDKKEFQRKLQTRFSPHPFLPNNLQTAIEQMRYVAEKNEVQRILKAPVEDQKKMFEEFWEAKDPSPGTPVNELMVEYYQRVAFSNLHFSSLRDGWKTDMGMVYILYGPPSDVQREPYNVFARRYSGREIHAYENWFYYEVNRQFIFADYNGFGEFYLLNPEAVYLDH